MTKDLLKRAVRRRMARHRPGDEALDISELVSPLRYDIMVRASYFSFLARHLDLYRCDFPAYLDRARGEPYFLWFREIGYARHRLYDPTDAGALHAAFVDRVHKSARLFASFQERGFDSRFPVSVRRATPPTASGKAVVRKYYAADGCHRLALLLASGVEALPAHYYTVGPGHEDAPLDNTLPLLAPLAVTSEEYFAFLSRGYADQVFTDSASLVDWVAANARDRVEELEQVISIDQPMVLPPGSRPHDAAPSPRDWPSAHRSSG